MKSMALAAVGLIICSGTFYIGFVGGITMEQFNAWQTGWQKHLCEDDDGTLLAEMLGCMMYMSDEAAEIFIECQLAGLPGTTNPIAFVKAGCSDAKVFEAYNECAQRHKEKEDFLEMLEESSKAYDCYVDAMKNRGFEVDA